MLNILTFKIYTAHKCAYAPKWKSIVVHNL